jgi:hypothetical protein
MKRKTIADPDGEPLPVKEALEAWNKLTRPMEKLGFAVNAIDPRRAVLMSPWRPGVFSAGECHSSDKRGFDWRLSSRDKTCAAFFDNSMLRVG